MADPAPDETVVHVLWMNAGLSCDGDSVALMAAMRPSIDEIGLGALPGLPRGACLKTALRRQSRLHSPPSRS